ncbi:MAG: hypothetical protein JOZ87_39465 [Chloroflexi bacterium]|nr:hypothetical protein [Chloroflexota bacterium]
MSQTPRSSPRDDGPVYATGPSASGQGAVDQAQEKVAQVVDQAQGVAGQVAEQAKQQATSQLASQKDRAVDGLVTVAQALRQTGQTLQQQKQETVGGYVEQAAERVESMTNYLRAHDVQELVEDTQNLARRQPALFLTGALALGFIGARFLMSSGRRAEAQQRSRASYGSGVGGSGAPDTLAYGGYPGRTQRQLGSPGYPAIEPPEVATSPGTFGVGGGLEA